MHCVAARVCFMATCSALKNVCVRLFVCGSEDIGGCCADITEEGSAAPGKS